MSNAKSISAHWPEPCETRQAKQDSAGLSRVKNEKLFVFSFSGARCAIPSSLTRRTRARSLRRMSRLPFELLLALRYLRPKRTFVSVISLISVLGVTLGVAVLIIVISVMSGFDRQLREKILGFSPHLRIVKPNRTLHDYQAAMWQVSSIQ